MSRDFLSRDFECRDFVSFGILKVKFLLSGLFKNQNIAAVMILCIGIIQYSGFCDFRDFKCRNFYWVGFWGCRDLHGSGLKNQDFTGRDSLAFVILKVNILGVGIIQELKFWGCRDFVYRDYSTFRIL